MFWKFKETRMWIKTWLKCIWKHRPHWHNYECQVQPGEEEHGIDYTKRFCKICNREQWLLHANTWVDSPDVRIDAYKRYSIMYKCSIIATTVTTKK